MGSGTGVLVTGAGGQVGRALVRVLPGATFATRDELDVTDAAAVATAVSGHEAVVHLAALTDVDGCETRELEAARVNVEGTRHVLDAAIHTRARVVLLSTDYVFDGRADVPYRENDATNPLNVYGRTKRDAEELVIATDAGLVIRTSWVFGEGRNFIRSILNAARATDTVTVVDDQRATPTSADAVAIAIGHTLDAGISGLLHVAGTGDVVSWADLAAFVLDLTDASARVESVTSAEYAAALTTATAPRPSFSALDVGYAHDLGVPLLDWRTSVIAYVEGAA